MKSNFFSSKAFFFSFCVLFLMACQAGKENYVYVSDCKYLSKDSLLSGEIKLILEGDTATILLPDNDPIQLLGLQGEKPLVSMNLMGITVNFSNRDSIYGLTIKNTVVRDTLVRMDPVSKSETIQVVENTLSDTLGSCIFKKTKVK